MNTEIDKLEREEIIFKLNSFFDIDIYCDFLFLGRIEFEKKYGHYGFSFNNFLTIRFNDEPNIFKEICSFLPLSKYYFMPIEKDIKTIFIMTNIEIEMFLGQNNISDFIIFDSKKTWLLVYNRYRYLTGLGNYIKKRVRQNVNLKFGNVKLMLTNTDEIE